MLFNYEQFKAAFLRIFDARNNPEDRLTYKDEAYIIVSFRVICFEQQVTGDLICFKDLAALDQRIHEHFDFVNFLLRKD